MSSGERDAVSSDEGVVIVGGLVALGSDAGWDGAAIPCWGVIEELAAAAGPIFWPDSYMA
jgi:hypothetical protein